MTRDDDFEPKLGKTVDAVVVLGLYWISPLWPPFKIYFSSQFVHHRVNRGRVALGSHPPRAPTDPYVRNSRIRFFRS